MKLLPLVCSQCGGHLDPETFTCKSCGTSFVSKLGNLTFIQVEVGDMAFNQVNMYMEKIQQEIKANVGEDEKFIILPTRNGMGAVTVKQFKYLKE